MPRTFSVRWVFRAIVEADDPDIVAAWADQRRQAMHLLLQSPPHPHALVLLGSAPDEMTCQEMPDREGDG